MNKLKLVCLILLGILALCSCKNSPRYEFRNYEKAELVALINENEDLFNEVVRVVVEDDDFYEKGSRGRLDDSFIGSPYDEEVGLFNQFGQQVIHDFFQFRPYMISYDLDKRFIKITFIGDIDTVESYVFMYWIDAEDVDGLENQLIYLRQRYTICTDGIPEGWYFYYKELN